jgi:hypothetical protein
VTVRGRSADAIEDPGAAIEGRARPVDTSGMKITIQHCSS